MVEEDNKRFAYYVSGHGYGHATRVIALTLILLERGHSVSIVSNAPERIFVDAIESGASYRQADIDAGISQPKAYDVDRQQTLKGLQEFLSQHAEKVQTEKDWLIGNRIDAVLVDAPFLPCAAAAEAGLPSAIISNFDFAACYSYLDLPQLQQSSTDTEPDLPIPTSVLQPLVQQTIADYSNASLLLRLPGAIPIPAFDDDVPMPASTWVDQQAKQFTPEIISILQRTDPHRRKGKRIVEVPLIVRQPTAAARDPQSRYKLLNQAGVPQKLQDSKILLVSFGGQSIPRPGSRVPSPSSSPRPDTESLPDLSQLSPALARLSMSPPLHNPPVLDPRVRGMKRIATSNHLYLPDAPKAATHHYSPTMSPSPTSLSPVSSSNRPAKKMVPNQGVLPPGWIALVCGLRPTDDGADELPQGFFAGPTDIYMPDACRIADVQLGKLGYGTVSETIDAQLPFVFVPRPLFVEEYGLKRLAESRNTLVEMDRTSFEDGRWATFIEEAYAKHQLRAKDTIKNEHAGPVIVDEIEQWLKRLQ